MKDLTPGRIYLIPEEGAFDLTIEAALTSGINLLVCGNRLPFYDIAYALAGRVGQAYHSLLQEKILFSRAETCTQFLDFLSHLSRMSAPLLVTDMLSRFNDEDERQVDELFFACQVELQRLSKDELVFVTARARPPLERLGYALSRITQLVEGIA